MYGWGIHTVESKWNGIVDDGVCALESRTPCHATRANYVSVFEMI